MDAEVRGCGEPLPTEVTGVRPRPGVDRLVITQTLTPGERLPTHVTDKRAVVQVGVGVVSKRGGRGEDSITSGALQGFVDRLVSS